MTYGDGKTVNSCSSWYPAITCQAVASPNFRIPADGSQQQQATHFADRRPASNGLPNAFQVFHGTVCGVQGSNPKFCAGGAILSESQASAHLWRSVHPNQTLTDFGLIPTFTLHVKRISWPSAGCPDEFCDRAPAHAQHVLLGELHRCQCSLSSHILEDVNNANTDAVSRIFADYLPAVLPEHPYGRCVLPINSAILRGRRFLSARTTQQPGIHRDQRPGAASVRFAADFFPANSVRTYSL